MRSVYIFNLSGDEVSMDGIFKISKPSNEPVTSCAPGTPERNSLKAQLEKMLKEEIEIPLVIGGEEVRTESLGECRCPHDQRHLLGRFHQAGPKEIEMTIQEAQKAWQGWSEMNSSFRSSIFLRAAELLSQKYRLVLNAATMLGQSKTVHQAEIDSGCELTDFYRFNP